MNRFTLTIAALATGFAVYAQSVTATWQFSDPTDATTLGKVSFRGNASAQALVTTDLKLGAELSEFAQLTTSGAEGGQEAITYEPAFTAITPSKKVTKKTEGHCVSFTVTPNEGHTYKPLKVAFDATKVGTDGGNIDVYYELADGTEKALATGLAPARNKVSAINKEACTHFEFYLGDVIVDSKPFTVTIYLMNINGVNVTTPKQIALRNIEIKGAVDEELGDADLYIKGFTFKSSEVAGQEKEIDLLPFVANLKNGATAAYPNMLYSNPTDFKLTMAPGFDYALTFKDNVARVDIYRDEDLEFTFNVRFKVRFIPEKGPAKPLNRGLMAVSLTGAGMGKGALVSWRHRVADGYGVKYKLYRGESPEAQDEILNSGLYITDRTNYLDEAGTANSYYRLETYDKTGKLLENEVSRKTWNNQTFRIPIEKPDVSKDGATYTPNDASYCDMDGDGEYEIILKWSPSNEKDAASSGTTSPVLFDCIKMDGTRLWRIDMGNNFFTSAHTIQFIAWDFDGDGYGEFMVKTAPGTIDGQGNYVLLGNDDPNENLLSGSGKQDHGSEYITVFDGMTGAELATIPYHTAYSDVSTSIWGDSKQNRSERYLAGLAYLDGPDANPSPIFARGYYAGAFVGAYDWDGKTLKERWVSRNTTSGQGLWGQGAHWMACGDCDGDGKHEIVYGSAALDHDGSLLYRTGLGHGDALHLGDFLPEREGLEVFMVHESKPYGCDLRDAKTGELLIHQTATGDTGRGIAAHFDPTYPHSQFTHSSDAGMHDCLTGERYTEGWNPGGGGSMNNRLYWDGDLYDEHYDKSCIAKWDPSYPGFGRIQVNKTNYTVGTLNNYTKYNPCVLGDLLGDWREEIVLWEEGYLIINATSYTTDYRIPHLMDDLNYRVQVVNQNCCYNQPPHLSVDPAIVYADNPNRALQHDVSSDYDGIDEIDAAEEGQQVIYNLQGMRLDRVTTPGLYIVNGKKVMMK